MGLGSSPPVLTAPADGTPHAPPALRVRTRGWRDPRLWIGVALVAASVLLGARLLAAADDSVAVWAVAADAGAGDRLTTGDLVVARVGFDDEAALGGYLRVEEPLPEDLTLTRPVGAGELLPRSALGTAEDSGLLHVPVAVEPELVPPSVGAGDVVDVHLVPTAGSGRPAGVDDGPALPAVTVLEAPEAAATFAATTRRQLVLAVPEETAERWFRLLGVYDAPSVTVVRRG